MTTTFHHPTSLLVFAAAPGNGDDGSGTTRPSSAPIPSRPNRAVGGPYLMLASVLLGVGIGYLLDRNYLTTPRWTVGLGLLGIAVGLYHAVREASR